MSNRLQFTNHFGTGEFVERGRSASAREAKNLFDDMPWKLVSALRITNPEGGMLEVVGSQSEGFRMRCQLGRERCVAEGSPNAALCREVIGLFAAGDPGWEDATDWDPEAGHASADMGSVKAGGCLGLLLAGLGLAVAFAMFEPS